MAVNPAIVLAEDMDDATVCGIYIPVAVIVVGLWYKAVSLPPVTSYACLVLRECITATMHL